MRLRAKAGLALAFAAIAFLGALAFIRLAPSEPAAWHVDLSAPGFDPGKGQLFCATAANRLGPVPDAGGALARLDAIAMATPRTERLAGSAVEGRITWITRTALMGYPDYTTAQALPDGGLCIFGRQRFGEGDFGVNAARVGAWAQALLGLDAVPPMTGPAAP